MLVFLLFKKKSESDYMLTIETKELQISKELKRKVEMVYRLANVKYTIMEISKKIQILLW